MTMDEVQLSAAHAGWDGKDLPYRPRVEVPVDPRLRFHQAEKVEVDPITFEVLSSRLWSINEEHADTIMRVSGSPVVVHNFDFNTCISTERGEPFLFAPYLQYFTAASELVVKYTLENRSGNPGINPGDVFISNDPFIAGSHQMDVCVYAPVFLGDELFCWVFNSCHARDIGGVEPGSFCIQATDRYAEPAALRALKLANSDGILADVEDTILRLSRIPHLLALELRSQIAGVNRARQRMEELCAQYPPAVVKSTMTKLVDDTERAVRERLRSLPDGTWSETCYFSGASIGDRQPHKMALSLEKRGDSLVFSNAGTDAQVGSVNCGYGQYRAAISSALLYTLAFDHRFCLAGVLRCAQFDAEVGTISSVDREGAITSTHAQLLTIYMAGKLLGKMMFPDPFLRQNTMGTSGLATCAWITFSGIDQWGSPFASVSLDHSGGGMGAFSFRDGVDQGGTTFWPKGEIPDCETYEHYYPILYLYRRGPRNGGHGKYRGGNGVSFAWVGHGTESQRASFISMAGELPVQSGIFGGHWGDTGTFVGLQDSNIRELIAEGRIPASPDDLRGLSGSGGRLPAKTLGHRLHESDVVGEEVFGGGGYGDPIERDPEFVGRDVAAGAVRGEIAAGLYGVVLSSSGEVDLAATAAARQQIREERLARATFEHRWSGGPLVDTIVEVGERVLIGTTGVGDLVHACSGCGSVLGPAEENYKRWSGRIDGALHDVDPQTFVEPGTDVDAATSYRSYVCPSCGVLFENELTLAGEPPLWDVRIDLESLSGRRWAVRNPKGEA